MERGEEGRVHSGFTNGSIHHHESIDDSEIVEVNDVEKSEITCLEIDDSSRKGDNANKWEERTVNPDCIHASNPYHSCTEFCFKKMAEGKNRNKRRDQPVQNGERSKEQEQEWELMVGRGRRNVDPLCVNASNPYHVCAEYCTNKRTMNTARKPTWGGRSDKKEGLDIGQNRKVDPRCVNASNPYHVCADNCFQKMHEKGQAERVVVGEHKKGSSNVLERKDVHPKCVNASNPYHKCAECCFQRIKDAS